MSKAISIRLDDQVLEDARAYAKGQGVSVTDVIIQGINAILHPCNTLPVLPIMPVESTGAVVDPMYEPDPVKPVKVHKPSAAKQAAPVVAALLSSINKRVTVSHHVQCSCAMCK